MSDAQQAAAGDISELVIPASMEAFVAEAAKSPEGWWRIAVDSTSSAQPMMESKGDARRSLVMDLARLLRSTQRLLDSRRMVCGRDKDFRVNAAARELFAKLIRAQLDFTDDEVAELLTLSAEPSTWKGVSPPAVVIVVERHLQSNPITPTLKAAIGALFASIKQTSPAAERKQLTARLEQLLGALDSRGVLERCEPWATLASDEVAALAAPDETLWLELLASARGAKGTSPSRKYLAAMLKQIEKIGVAAFKERLSRWMGVAARESIRQRHPLGGDETVEAPLHAENADVLKGLVWASLATGDAALAVPIGELAERCYRKLPWFGPRCVKVANACVAALSTMAGDEAAAQLAGLKARVKQPTGRKMIDKAVARLADRLGLSPEQVEERGVPAYGLDAAGVRRDAFGEYTAVTCPDAGDLTVKWIGPDAKPRKALPLAVKSRHAAAWRQLQATHKQIKLSLAGQRARLEGLLLSQRSWPLDEWRSLYLNAPLLSGFVRRLIWLVDGQAVVPSAEGLTNFGGTTHVPTAKATVSLWHPALRPAAEVLAWRERLVTLQVTQPFKQAHREIYLLTDAERRTETYSNRFAAHVLRQHQFSALCQQRGWAYRLQGAFDSHNTPTLDLPRWNVRAEFWVEAPEGRDDLSDSGICVHVLTDQVRFVDRNGGGPLRLVDVPPLLLSEVLRDVDLFVGVASVGNDPTWQDGGPAGRYAEYWQNYSFGDLSETARTRKAALHSLLPRLTKIRDRCTLTEKFLVVRGTLRTYKIHLGSGNIQMEPNDQYLCIVPDAAKRKGNDVLLPFEGDATLSIILSKAFLLAADEKITDPTITRQILTV